MPDFTMPDKNILSGLIDAGDVEACLALWELAEEAVLEKAEDIDSLKETFEDYEKQYKTSLKTLTREQSKLKLDAKKLNNAKFTAQRRQKIMDDLARRKP